jgi:hypothetical protein
MCPLLTNLCTTKSVTPPVIQGGQKVSVHLMITVQKHAKIF